MHHYRNFAQMSQKLDGLIRNVSCRTYELYEHRR